jgi:hypothetical protein
VTNHSWWLCPAADFAATAQRELPRILADPKAKLMTVSPHQFSEPARKKPVAYHHEQWTVDAA